MTRIALILTLLAAGMTACTSPLPRTEIDVVVEANDSDVRQWNDDRLIRVYFLVHQERIRITRALRDWDPALRHDHNKPWYRHYLAKLSNSERVLKRELRRRRLVN